MKLCIIASFPLPGKSPSSGPDSVVFNFVQAICDIDKSIKIDIVTISNDVKKEFIDILLPNVRVHYLPSHKYLSRSFGDPIIIKKFFGKHSFDIIHAHYPIALSLIMKIDTPKVLTLHGIFHIEKKFVANPFVRFFYHDYNTYMLKQILPKLDGFVAISPYVIDVLNEMKLYNKIKRVYLINNPIDKLFFNAKTKIEANNVIFYPAGIRKLKNQIAAIRAIKQVYSEIRDLKLILAGGYDKKYFKTIFNEIIKYKLTDVVEYKGVLSKDEILEYYNKSSIVYLLSNQEVQPMVIIEAMVTGTPVIASNIESISYLIEHGVTGYLVDPNDSKKVAEYSIDLLTNLNKRRVMGNNAKELARKKYNPDIIMQQTLEMYQEILNSKKVGLI